MTSDMHDLRAEVVAHPWRSVALAFAAGGCVALTGSRRPVIRAIAATLMATMLDTVRGCLKAQVESWIDARAIPTLSRICAPRERAKAV